MPFTFHPKRYRNPHRQSLWGRLWEFHDDHPLPAPLNRGGRRLLYYGRRASAAAEALRTRDRPDAVSRDHIAEVETAQPMSLERAAAWFQRIHEANEAVRRPDGAWEPHPHALYAGLGVPIEEVALRIPGYLGAYAATSDPAYLERAQAAGAYLLRERVFADGHVRLQAHLIADFTYAIAGVALLQLWEHDPSNSAFFEAARRIGDRLVEHHIAGSVNHTAIPAQLLAPLYRHTGDARYLRAAHKRVFRSVVPFQLPTGDWEGHESRSWYQGVNVLSLIATYTWTPFDLKHARRNDRLAETLTAAINRLLLSQDASGALDHSGRGAVAGEWEPDVVTFQDGAFVPSVLPGGYRSHGAYEMDALVTAYEGLHVDACASAAHRYAAHLAGMEQLWRLEFNTLGAGRYLSLLRTLVDEPAAAARV